MKWILWAILLVVQNASFTLVSRARNSSSLGYHAWASALSNLIWFASQYILVDSMLDLLRSGDALLAVFTGAFYAAFTMAGSVGMHAVSMRYIERPRGGAR